MIVDSNFLIAKDEAKGIVWINPLKSKKVKIYRFYWINQDQQYSRLPLNSKKKLQEICPNVLLLAKNTSGGQLHFRTTSDKLIIRAKIDSYANMSRMTAVAASGFDCYVGKNFDDLKFYNSSAFDPFNKEYEATLFTGNQKDMLVVINFPLYSGVKELSIGVNSNADVTPIESFIESERIVVYGTSITQGGCASRPGLSYTNILSRRLKREIFNFGFSGNAFGEIELIEILAQINPISMFVIDYEANSGTNGKLELTLVDIIKKVRQYHKETELVIISRISYLFEDMNPSLGTRREQLKEFQRNTVRKCKRDGDEHIHFIDGSEFFGDNYHEFTVDSKHPNDLGFNKIVESLEPKLKKILKI